MKQLKATTIRELAKAIVEQNRERQVSRHSLIWIFERIACDKRSDGYVPKFIQDIIDERENPKTTKFSKSLVSESMAKSGTFNCPSSAFNV